jgi:hypothetical protein
MKHKQHKNDELLLAPGAGRSYRCGRMTAEDIGELLNLFV